MKEARVRRLDWDSTFFDKEIGRVDLTGDNARLSNDKGFDLIYFFSPTTITAHDFPPCIDKKVVFVKRIENLVEPPSNIEIYEGELTQDLIDLAIESGVYSRFKRDEKLAPYFEKLYTLWISNSIETDFADYILVAKDQDKIIGFLTLKQTDDYFQIGLISVSKNHRGKGIAKALLRKVEAIAGENSTVRVATQIDNDAAGELYVNTGYTYESLTYIYHLWQ